MYSVFQQELDELEESGLRRRLRDVTSANGPRIVIGGKELVNLCSNNYLGLANHPALKKAAQGAAEKYGTGAGASRFVSGNNILYKELEEKLARFKKTDAALVYGSGYLANLGIISALVNKDDVVFSDKLNHASIIDGIILSRAECKRYPHKDTRALKELLKGAGKYKRRLIITDALFSMDGDLAPIPDLAKIAKEYDCMLMIDEAHSSGVFGKNGRGALEHFGLEGKVDIVMGTLSKALGGYGGFVCAKNEIIDYLINKSRVLVYSTALPASVLASATKALELIEMAPSLRDDLWRNVSFLKKGLTDIGFDAAGSESQIIQIIIGDNRKTVEASKKLFEEGVFVQAIRPPSVPEGTARLRVSVMATHTRGDLEKVIDVFRQLRG